MRLFVDDEQGILFWKKNLRADDTISKTINCKMYFITNGIEATGAVFTPVDKTVAVLCALTEWEQVLLLSRMFMMDHFERLCFHRSLAGFRLMSTFTSWILDMQHLTRLEVTDSPGFGIEVMGQFLRAVSKSTVKYLNVNGMCLGSEGARLLCKTVIESRGRIHTLRAERNMMQTGVRQILELPLKRVDVGDNDVHRLWWRKYIKGISNSVRRLSLESSGIGIVGMEALGRFVQRSPLVELNLSGNSMKPASIKNLCQGMIGHAHLAILYLNECQLQNWNLKTISAMLPLNHSLQQLYMHGNPGIDESGQLYLIDAMQKNYTLRYMEIDVLFEKKCMNRIHEPSRISIEPTEPVTVHLTRLVCSNQDLDLARRNWEPKLHHFYPVCMQKRACLVIDLLRPILPYELILHILSFWHGIQFT